MHTADGSEAGRDATEAGALGVRLRMNVRRHGERLLLVLVRMERRLQAWHVLRVLRHLGVIDLAARSRLSLRTMSRLHLPVRLLSRGVLALDGRGRRLGHDGPAVHPVESDQERRVDLDGVRCLHELSLDDRVVGLLVVRQGADVLVQVLEVLWKDLGREQLSRLDFEFILHHLLETFLIRLVPPRQLTDAKVRQKEEERLDVVFLEVLLVGQVSGERCVHGRADDAEVVLLLDHVFSQRLHSGFLLAGLRVDDVDLLLLFATWPSALDSVLGIDRRVGTVLLLGEAEVDQVDEVRLVGLIADDHVGWLEVTMNIALRVYAVESIHQLQGNNYDGLN